MHRLSWALALSLPLGLVSTVSAQSGGQQQQPKTYQVSGQAVAVYSSPGGSQVGVSPRGATLQGTGQEQGSWIEVQFNGQRAWVSSSLVSEAQGGGQQSNTWVVTADRLNVREGPGLQHAVMGQLQRGTTVESAGESGAWKRIKLQGSSREAWVHGGYLSQQGASTDGSSAAGGAGGAGAGGAGAGAAGAGSNTSSDLGQQLLQTGLQLAQNALGGGSNGSQAGAGGGSSAGSTGANGSGAADPTFNSGAGDANNYTPGSAGGGMPLGAEFGETPGYTTTGLGNGGASGGASNPGAVDPAASDRGTPLQPAGDGSAYDEDYARLGDDPGAAPGEVSDFASDAPDAGAPADAPAEDGAEDAGELEPGDDGFPPAPGSNRGNQGRDSDPTPFDDPFTSDREAEVAGEEEQPADDTAGPDQPAAEGAADERSAFERADADGDGHVTHQEGAAFVEELGGEWTRSALGETSFEGLSEAGADILLAIASACAANQVDMVVTGAAEQSGHRPGSSHYTGDAIDLRTSHMSSYELNLIQRAIEEQLVLLGHPLGDAEGELEVVVEYSPPHLHLERN